MSGSGPGTTRCGSLNQREIPDRLGWLSIADEMLDEVPTLERFAEEVQDDGYNTAVLLGMGGSSLAPEVLQATCGTAPSALRLEILDSTLPASIRALEKRIDLEHTLFIVASKSGTTIEPLAHLAHFWEKVPRGDQYVAITDPGTPLEREAIERQFRRVFLNRTDIGGRYSALFALRPGSWCADWCRAFAPVGSGNRDGARLPSVCAAA